MNDSISLFFRSDKFNDNGNGVIPFLRFVSCAQVAFIFGCKPSDATLSSYGISNCYHWDEDRCEGDENTIYPNLVIERVNYALERFNLEKRLNIGYFGERNIQLLITIFFICLGFRDITVFDFDLPEPEDVDRELFDIFTLVLKITNASIKAPGTKYLNFVGSACYRRPQTEDQPLYAEDRSEVQRALQELNDSIDPLARAFITLTSPGYEWGTIVLLNSLQKFSATSVVVLCTAATNIDLINDNLNSPSLVSFLKIPNLQIHKSKLTAERYGNTLGKFFVLGLHKIQCVVFLDSDMLIRGSIEHLFDCGEKVIYATHAFENHVSRNIIQSSIFSLSPSESLFNDFLNSAIRNSGYGGQGDHGYFIGHFSSNWGAIQDEFAYNWSHQFTSAERIGEQDPRVVHFHGFKPWERVVGRGVYLTDSPYLKEWYSVLSADQLVAFITDFRKIEAERESRNIVTRYLKNLK